MEEVKLVFMAGNYCFLWILCVWNGGYGDGAAELAGDVITELLFTVQFQHINECKSPLIGVLLMQQVVLYNSAVLRDRRDYQGKGVEEEKNLTKQTPITWFCCYRLTAVCLLCVPFWRWTWWQGIKSRLWNSHLPFLGMNQMPWNNKPTGSIIIPSPCNQHSRLMRQKMKTSARENLLVLFKVPKEEQAQTGTDSYGDHEKLIRPEMKMRSLFPANQIV